MAEATSTPFASPGLGDWSPPVCSEAVGTQSFLKEECESLSIQVFFGGSQVTLDRHLYDFVDSQRAPEARSQLRKAMAEDPTSEVLSEFSLHVSWQAES